MSTTIQSRLKNAGRWLPVALLPLLPFAVQAQAPANDNPSGAIVLPLGATCTPLATTNAGATTTAAAGLGYTNPGCGIAASPKDVWYTFTTAAAGQQGSTAATITVTGTPAGQVRVFSSAGGAAGPFVTVGCAAGTTNNTQAPALALRGLTPATTYYVDVAGYGSADTQGAFTICATTLILPANDAGVTSIFSLGQVTQAYNSPQVVRAVVTNFSLGALTNVPVTLTVSGANTFTSTQTVASLAPNASATVTFPSYPLTNVGLNTLTVTVPADDVLTNNSQVFTQNVSTTRLSFIDGSQPLNATGVGVGAAGGALAAKYTLTQAGSISSVTPSFVGAGAGATTYQVQLYDATGAGGTPGTLLYTSPTQTRPTATGSTVIAVPNISIGAGDFFVAIKELDLNVGLGYQVEDPLRTGTFYYQVPGGAWTAVNSTTLRTRLALEVGVAGPPACASASNLTATTVTSNSASLTFTGGTGVTYTITYQAAGGAVQTVTPAPAAGPVNLTGLTPSTVYNVSVITNCAGGLTSSPATITFTTLGAPAIYATLPFTEGFEGPWATNIALRDIPSANWRNTPATGDNSWRREDDGFTTLSGSSANWRYPDNEAPTPAFPIPPYVTRFSTGAHSARFHSFGSASGLQGKLDMYVNMSAAGNKTLSFDYINPTGTDKLEVLVSTDGGVTFGATPILTATTNTAFTAKTVAVNSNSATTVIRFQATSDFGDDDLGIDNVQLRVISATTNSALAATVSLYPNPAHQSFQLNVPTTLRNASASLSNALGQVVQVRELNLPVAGGTATFNVSNLAAGVYTLTLKSGTDLVVKRVVVE